MRKIKTISFVILAMIAFSGCKPAKDKTVEKITVLENELLSATVKIDSTKAQQLIDLYVSYVDQFKTDSVSPVYLLKAADISMNIMKHTQSINLLDKIIFDYPNFSKTSDCLFLKAFIYENQTNDLEKAEKTYKEFLEKYPDSELAPSARAAVENMGVPVDVLIKRFEEKNKAAKDSVEA